MDIFMGKGITRRLLTKRLLLLGTALVIPSIQNKKSTQTSSPTLQSIDERFVSVNGWVVSKSELSSKGIKKDAS